MNGMNRENGKVLSDMEHLHQSVVDILTTPIGTRVMRRDYGSRLFDLTDTGLNNSGVMDIYAAVVTALAQWEPRITVSRVQVTPDKGMLLLSLEGIYRPAGTSVSLDNISVRSS